MAELGERAQILGEVRLCIGALVDEIVRANYSAPTRSVVRSSRIDSIRAWSDGKPAGAALELARARLLYEVEEAELEGHDEETQPSLDVFLGQL
jgi:hypothetical protein